MVLLDESVASPEGTLALGHAFGALLRPGDVVSLIGDLGTGKTVFTKGVAMALGCDPHDVQSPTFTLVREYEGMYPLYHLDLYRLEEPGEELLEIGYEEYFFPDKAISLIEWGDRAEELLPDRRFEIRLAVEPEGRRIRIRAKGEDPERITQMRRRLEERPATSGSTSSRVKQT